MKVLLRKQTLGDITFSIINGLVMLLVVVATLYPFLNTIAVSFNNGIDTIRGGLSLATGMDASELCFGVQKSAFRTSCVYFRGKNGHWYDHPIVLYCDACLCFKP